MCPWEHADLHGDVSHILETPAVDADSLFDDPLADPVLERFVEELADDLRMLGKPFAKLDDGPPAEVVDVGLAGRLVRLVEHLVQAQREVFADDLDHLLGI